MTICSLCVPASVEELHGLAHMMPTAQRPARLLLGIDLYQAKTLRAGLGKRPPACVQTFITEDAWDESLIEKEDSRVYQASGSLQRVRKRRLAPADVPLTTRLLVFLYGMSTCTISEVQLLLSKMHTQCLEKGVSSQIADREGLIDCSQPETASVSESLARRVGLAQYLQRTGAVPGAAAAAVACTIDQLVYSEWGPSAQRRPPLEVVAGGGFVQRPPSGLAGHADLSRLAATAAATSQHLGTEEQDETTHSLDRRDSDGASSVSGSVASDRPWGPSGSPAAARGNSSAPHRSGSVHSQRSTRKPRRTQRSTLAARSGFPAPHEVNAQEDPWTAAMYAPPPPPTPPPPARQPPPPHRAPLPPRSRRGSHPG